MKYAFIAALFLAVVALAGCTKDENQQAAEDAGNIIQQAEQAQSGIKVPDSLLTNCDEAYFTETVPGGSGLRDCDDFGGGSVCSYYKEVKNGEEKIKVLQYNTECHACRFYGKTGEKFISGPFLKKPCGKITFACITDDKDDSFPLIFLSFGKFNR